MMHTIRRVNKQSKFIFSDVFAFNTIHVFQTAKRKYDSIICIRNICRTVEIISSRARTFVSPVKSSDIKRRAKRTK
jgi:hypothetical protein